MSDLAAYFDKDAGRLQRFYAGSGLLHLADRVARRALLEYFEIVRGALPNVRGLKIFDAGCGPGLYVSDLAERGAYVTGADLSPNMLRAAVERVTAAGVQDRVTLLQCDFREVKPPSPYDVSLAVGVADYLPTAGSLLEPLRQITNGLIIATFPRRDSLWARFRRFRYRRQGIIIRGYDTDEVVRAAGDVGLVVMQVRQVANSGGGIVLIARSEGCS